MWNCPSVIKSTYDSLLRLSSRFNLFYFFLTYCPRSISSATVLVFLNIYYIHTFFYKKCLNCCLNWSAILRKTNIRVDTSSGCPKVLIRLIKDKNCYFYFLFSSSFSLFLKISLSFFSTILVNEYLIVGRIAFLL